MKLLGIEFNPIETLPKDGSDVVLKTCDGIVSAWYDKEKSDWVCYDDMFSIDGNDNNIVGWMSFDLGD